MADLAGRELRFAQGYREGLNLDSWLADRDPENLISSPASNVIVMAARDGTSCKVEITLGPDFLPIEERQISLADTDHPVSNQTMLFDQWEATDGVKFPRHRSNLHFDEKVAEITTDEIQLNRGIKPSDLAIAPPENTPVMCSH